MIKVDNFRNFYLYKRSLNLTTEVLSWTNCNKELLSDNDSKKIRGLAMTVSKKIASAIAQVNIKIRFKKLNEVKKLLNNLYEIFAIKKEDIQINKRITELMLEVYKLLNGYFRWLKSN